ncbi:MraY family glycosyltransferase [Inquilinus limosus]|uniref:MraY family glycosyltransferase n=2 Tax=Inquilinus limosus TaxID=171674 RepID=UPI003F5CDC4A
MRFSGAPRRLRFTKGGAMPNLAAHLLNGFLLAVVLVVWMQRIAPRLGLLDHPTARKAHEGVVPVCGGLAMFAAYVIGTCVLEPTWRAPWSFIGGLAILVAVGAVDDRINLRPLWRLLAQALASIAMLALGGHMIGNFGSAFLDAQAVAADPIVSALVFCVTVLFLVGLTNAFNMIDGLDGLAGGTAASALFWLALMASFLGRSAAIAQLFVLLAVVLGFLTFNMRHRWRPRALVFMGDAGSTMLGAAIAYFIVDLSSGPQASIPFPVLLWVCIIPVVDTLSLMVRRLHAGRSPFSPDRWHLHHLLLERGLTHATATGVIVGLSILFGAIAYIGTVMAISDQLLTIGLLLPVTIHCCFVWISVRRARPLRPTATTRM